ncbi:hypothetical protein [Arthrobacter sp. RIT-PI-e]|uniref:hypothetical protein n=1 Tax=Arthrobacter sp. RIT-PI-e TaxID=1681197 RepID=UPI000A53EFA3|nr:hypothetical protein [Arthrobacter sp. RIT-PI-e]
MKREPIQQISAHWDTPLSSEEVLTAVSGAFEGEKVTTDASSGIVEVRSGSNFKYRMWGESWNGYKNLPVALALEARDTPEGSTVDVRAFDTFGFRMTDHLFMGADVTLKSKLVHLMEVASSTLKPHNPGWS